MSDVNRRFLLRERPTGRIDEGTFELVEEAIPEIGEGEALVRTRWISSDPTNRACCRIRAWLLHSLVADSGLTSAPPRWAPSVHSIGKSKYVSGNGSCVSV